MSSDQRSKFSALKFEFNFFLMYWICVIRCFSIFFWYDSLSLPTALPPEGEDDCDQQQHNHTYPRRPPHHLPVVQSFHERRALREVFMSCSVTVNRALKRLSLAVQHVEDCSSDSHRLIKLQATG